MHEKHYRYMGVKPFEATNRSIFFGRDEDIEGLFNLILSEKLVVLFGKSGYGKSSLLNAGVLPLFQEEEEADRRARVVEVRLGAFVQGQTRSPRDSVLAKLEEKLPESGLPPDDGLDSLYPNAADRPLWYHVKRRQTAGEGGRFVVVFDQFEEFFSYPRAEQEQFKRELAELLYSDIPQYLRKHLPQLPPEAKRRVAQPMNVKAVFAIRADRMSLLDSMTDVLPAILHKRYELRSLTTAQAREAIVKPAGLPQNGFVTTPFEFTDAALQKILTELSANHTKGIEAFQLQILCQYIEGRIENREIPDRDRNGLPDVDAGDLPDMKNLYETYYRRQLDRLDPARQRPAQVVLEEGLLAEDPQSGEGRRMSVDSRFLKSQFGVDDELLRALENTYLVRKEPNSVGGESLEISHDTLVAPVLKMKKERRAKEELEEAKRREAEAERLAAVEGSRRRRANLLSGAAVFMSVIAAGLGIWAMNERDAAEQSRNEAVLEKNKTQKALDEFQKVEAEKVLAEVNDWLARSKSLRSRGYSEHADAMRDSVIGTLESYSKNRVLRDKLNELKK
ncbi:MAG: hypothetical protein JNJ90_14480 [Saprospiraceae bacterium]|nr:hypothetical protein [Saprospiraceae bacterium]